MAMVFSPLFQGTKYISLNPPPSAAEAAFEANRVRSILFKTQVAICKVQVASCVTHVSKLLAQVSNRQLRVARSSWLKLARCQIKFGSCQH